MTKYWEGKTFSEEHRRKLSEAKKGKHISPQTEFQKGLSPWNKGILGYKKGSQNGMWKGDRVGYYALHSWIRRNFGKPEKCQNCKSIQNIQWCNISGNYTREKTDWMKMCVPCHRMFDKGFSRAKEKYIESLET